MIDLFFLGGINRCIMCDINELPDKSRYICTVDGYSVYDSQDWEGTLYAIQEIKS